VANGERVLPAHVRWRALQAEPTPPQPMGTRRQCRLEIGGGCPLAHPGCGATPRWERRLPCQSFRGGSGATGWTREKPHPHGASVHDSGIYVNVLVHCESMDEQWQT
jgi:hypothetical protein